MIKIIDLDKVFDSYISSYVYKNIGKVKPEEIEDNMPVLYEKFGNEKIKELDNQTPNTYYNQYSAEELINCLMEHIEKGVSVSDFLYEAILANKESAEYIKKSIFDDKSEEYTAYAINLLSDMDADIPCDRFLEFAMYDYPDSIGELATESLSKCADKVKKQVIDCFNETPEDKKARLVEILSNCKKDDKVFDILITEFAKHQENYPLYASYLVKFGDERAVPFLKTAIESENINYADFEELRFSIEALGGEYDKKRDFSKDKFYKKIKGIKSTTEKQ